MTKARLIQIKPEQKQAKLSTAQKRFNSLIKNIDRHKKLLAEWQEVLTRTSQDAMTKLQPLNQALAECQVEMVSLLDRHFTTQKFTRPQREKIAQLICELCDELITLQHRDDMKSLYNKYSEDDFDTQEQESDALAADILKNMMGDAFGIELDDDDMDFDPSDPMATAQRLGEKVRQQQEQEADRRAKRKKTAKQLAKEAREQEEAAHVSKSVQAVYRQLVAALHPDRELDPVERERKTELMQKVTVAYGNQDLLQLLELQLGVEQIDQSKLNGVAETRLKHYNKVLQNQVMELREEIMTLEMQVGSMLELSPFSRITPKHVGSMLKEDIQRHKDMISDLKDDLQRFQDVKQLKRWLKDYQIPEPEFDSFFDMTPFDFK